MPGHEVFSLESGVGIVTENRDELVDRHFDISKPDSITNAKHDLDDSNPDAVPIQESAIARPGIDHVNQAVIRKLDTRMDRRDALVFQHDIAF